MTASSSPGSTMASTTGFTNASPVTGRQCRFDEIRSIAPHTRRSASRPGAWNSNLHGACCPANRGPSYVPAGYEEASQILWKH